MTMIDLAKLDFGAPAAERDIARGLEEYFFESDAYRRLLAGEKTIVIGNRGAGKSALFKVLAKRLKASGTIVLELKPEDYSYEMLTSVLKSEREGSWAKQGAYAAAWKYLVLVLVMKEMVDQGAMIKTGALSKLSNFLRDEVRDGVDDPVSVFVGYLRRIEGLKIGKFEIGIKAKELSALYKNRALNDVLPALGECCSRRGVVVLVDELDKGWDNSEDAKCFVSGLFQAAVSLNEGTNNLRVCVSLRQELYESIPALYDDAQKYRDIIETIRWDEQSLLAVVANRIRHCVPDLKERSDAECWAAAFVETLQYRKTRSFNYIIDRTLYRPRELIQFCTQILEVARPKAAVPFDYEIISQAEVQYSDSREKDIDSEYRYQYPGLQSIFEVFRGRVYTIERDELELICLEICTGDIQTSSDASWVRGQDHEFLIELLWRIGFLRAYAVGGVKAMRRSGSSYVGPHQVAALNVRTVSRFQVHPMFRASLGMKEPKAAQLHAGDE